MLLGVLILTPSAVMAQSVGLVRGEASLDAGQYEAAVRQLSAAVNDKNSTLEQSSKALYLRGIAYRKLGLAGRAVADLGAAIWLGLTPSDKVRALVNKGLAFRSAGLTNQAEAALDQARRASSAGAVDKIIAQDGSAQAVASTSASSDVVSGAGESVWDRLVPSFGSSSSSSSSSSTATSSSAPASAPEPEAAPAQTETRTAEAAPATGWNASVSDETAEPSGNAVSRWFGSLTGDSAPAPPSPPAAANPIPSQTTASRSASPPPQQTTSVARTEVAPPSAASWAANTETEKEGEGGTALGRWFSKQTSSEPAAAPAPAASQPQGRGYTVQLANSQSKSEAEALWTKAKSTNSQAASAGSRIERVDIGSFGTFYSVKIGPFASESESTKVCNALKRGGTDCSVVSPDGP
jgi:SPOR domain